MQRGIGLSTFSHDALHILVSPVSIAVGALKGTIGRSLHDSDFTHHISNTTYNSLDSDLSFTEFDFQQAREYFKMVEFCILPSPICYYCSILKTHCKIVSITIKTLNLHQLIMLHLVESCK